MDEVVQNISQDNHEEKNKSLLEAKEMFLLQRSAQVLGLHNVR